MAVERLQPLPLHQGLIANRFVVQQSLCVLELGSSRIMKWVNDKEWIQSHQLQQCFTENGVFVYAAKERALYALDQLDIGQRVYTVTKIKLTTGRWQRRRCPVGDCRAPVIGRKQAVLWGKMIHIVQQLHGQGVLHTCYDPDSNRMVFQHEIAYVSMSETRDRTGTTREHCPLQIISRLLSFYYHFMFIVLPFQHRQTECGTIWLQWWQPVRDCSGWRAARATGLGT